MEELINYLFFVTMGLTLAVGIIITRLQRDKNNESRTATYEYQIFILGKGKPYGTGIDFASWNELRTLFNCGWEVEAVLGQDSENFYIILCRDKPKPHQSHNSHKSR